MATIVKAPPCRATPWSMLNSLVRDPAIEKVDILAHSMGNFLVLETLRQMALRNRAIPSKIDDAILAAPDVDVDVFQSDILDMGNPHPKFTLFASRDDKALAISRWVWGSDARLGAIDPNVEPYKSRLASEHVNVFDLSDVKSRDATNHSKFVNSPDLVRLVGNRLASGQTPSDSHATVVDQFLATTANEVGSLETAVENAEAPQLESAAQKGSPAGCIGSRSTLRDREGPLRSRAAAVAQAWTDRSRR